MTKQEQIKHGLFGLILDKPCEYSCEFWDVHGDYCSISDGTKCKWVDSIVKYIDSQGVAIKAERPFPVMFGTVDSYCQGIRKMRESGWVFTEPLI